MFCSLSIFHTLVCDGDNDAVGSLIKSHIYQNMSIDLNIRRMECLSHVIRAMINNLIKNQLEASQVEAGECSMEEALVESKEIK